MIHVLLVDDHTVIRKGVRYMLEATADVRVIAVALHETEAVELAHAHHPDIVILDIFMPTMDGIKLARNLRACCAGTRILALSHLDSSADVKRALEAGVSGFVLKTDIRADLLEAIRSLYSGKQFFSRNILRSDPPYINDQAPSSRSA